MMISLDGITSKKSPRLNFLATNNEAEYEALLAGLITMQNLGGKTLKAYFDSRLVVGQVQGEYKEKDSRMLWYLNRVKLLSRDFHFFTLEQVPQGKNSHANSLAPWLRLVGRTCLRSYSLRVMCRLLMMSCLQ